MNEWMNERVNKRVNESVIGRMNESVTKRMNERMNERMTEIINERVNERTKEWLTEWNESGRTALSCNKLVSIFRYSPYNPGSWSDKNLEPGHWQYRHNIQYWVTTSILYSLWLPRVKPE